MFGHHGAPRRRRFVSGRDAAAGEQRGRGRLGRLRGGPWGRAEHPGRASPGRPRRRPDLADRSDVQRRQQRERQWVAQAAVARSPLNLTPTPAPALALALTPTRQLSSNNVVNNVSGSGKLLHAAYVPVVAMPRTLGRQNSIHTGWSRPAYQPQRSFRQPAPQVEEPD